MNDIKFLVMDVDGTLTDGMIYMGAKGELFKSFNVKNGYAIKEILPLHGIIPIIITARKSDILINRCRELGVLEVHQGCRNKLVKLKEILKIFSEEEDYDLGNVAYIGDDILDLECIQAVYDSGGLVACPSDAVDAVKHSVNYVSKYSAAQGAVRDIVEYITKHEATNIKMYRERIDFAVNYLKELDFTNIEYGTYEVNNFFYYVVKKYKTCFVHDCCFEVHKKNVDIQWVLNGTEKIKVYNLGLIPGTYEYDQVKDVVFFDESYNSHLSGRCTDIVLNEGSYCIIPPLTAHMPCIQEGGCTEIKKLIGKVIVK